MDEAYANYAYQLAQARQQEQAQLVAEQEAQAKKKQGISWGKFILVLIICAGLDALETFTGGLAAFVTWIGDLLILAITGISKKMVGGIIVDKVLLAVLPVRSAMWVYTFVASHPEWLEKLGKKLAGVSKVLKIASKIPSPVMPELQAASKIVDTASTATNAVNQAVQKTPQHMKANLQAARVAQPRSS